MPTTIEATELFQQAGVLFAPGKAANAGGVATSGLGNGAKRCAHWGGKPRKLMRVCITSCWISTMPVLSMVVKVSKPTTCRVRDIAGFVKVADAMLSQGRDLRQLCRIQRKRLIRP